MAIYALDPGTTHSAFVEYWGDLVSSWPAVENEQLLGWLGGKLAKGAPLVIESVESYGMAVGHETFETIHWAGRFFQVWTSCGGTVVRMPRKTVKLALCGSARANDANVRQVLVDRFGGKARAIGSKKHAGPLYDVKSHSWAALALAVTYQLQQELPPG